MRQTMITTKDNPFNYFTDFDNWYAFDEQKGYHSLSYLARIAKTSSDLTDKEYEKVQYFQRRKARRRGGIREQVHPCQDHIQDCRGQRHPQREASSQYARNRT